MRATPNHGLRERRSAPPNIEDHFSDLFDAKHGKRKGAGEAGMVDQKLCILQEPRSICDNRGAFVWFHAAISQHIRHPRHANPLSPCVFSTARFRGTRTVQMDRAIMRVSVEAIRKALQRAGTDMPAAAVSSPGDLVLVLVRRPWEPVQARGPRPAIPSGPPQI